MSWSTRDYKNSKTENQETLPPVVIHDDEPLPTYMVGLEDYDTDAPMGLTQWERQELRRQGYLTPAQLDRWAQVVKRGVTEL